MAEETNGPLVWIVDSQQWPRTLLRAELIERGIDAAGFADLDQAFLTIGRPGYPKPRAVVLELSGLDEVPIQRTALRRLGVPVILLGGGLDLERDWVRGEDWAAVMRRPFSIGMVADRVEELVR